MKIYILTTACKILSTSCVEVHRLLVYFLHYRCTVHRLTLKVKLSNYARIHVTMSVLL